MGYWGEITTLFRKEAKIKNFAIFFIVLASFFIFLPQALADPPISCSDILKQGLSAGDGEYL